MTDGAAKAEDFAVADLVLVVNFIWNRVVNGICKRTSLTSVTVELLSFECSIIYHYY